MTLATRRFLYISFIISFAVITPLLILYANGYELSFSRKVIVKTGMLILDSAPRGAKISLDGREQSDLLGRLTSGGELEYRTPAKIKRLLPGDYQVTFELPGYWPWSKKLPVYPGASTYAEDVVLFKNNLPIQLAKGAIREFSMSPAGGKAVFTLPDGRILFDLASEQLQPLAGSSTEPDQIRWSASGENFSVAASIYAASDGKLLSDLSPGIRTDAPGLTWDARDKNLAYYFKDTSLFVYDLATGQSRPLFTLAPAGKNFSLLDYFVHNNRLLLASSANDRSRLEVYDLAGREAPKAIELPYSRSYDFLKGDTSLINLKDTERRVLYLFDLDNPTLALFDEIKGFHYGEWVGGNKLLYTDDHDVNIYDRTSKNKTFVTRLSQSLSKLLWHPSNNYLIAATSQSLKIIELDERERHNITEILRLDEIGEPYLDRAGKLLYFGARLGNQQGLYKLSVQ